MTTLTRFRLAPQGGFTSTWTSDTIFGGLCWAIVQMDGEEALYKFLEECRNGNPPFVLSSGFPGDLLPKPLIPVAAKKGALSLASLQEAKKVKRQEWVTRETFDRLRRGEPADFVAVAKPYYQTGTLHNQISRLTNTTADDGNLYEVEETLLSASYSYISVYSWLRDESGLSQLTRWMNYLGLIGVGARRSSGLGSFTVLGTDTVEFDFPATANGFTILSHMVPKATDPTDGYYKTVVKRGRLGEHRGNYANPFKRPLLQIVPGSAFHTKTPAPFYGRMVVDIAPGAPDVVQSGFALALPARLPLVVEQSIE